MRGYGHTPCRFGTKATLTAVVARAAKARRSTGITVDDLAIPLFRGDIHAGMDPIRSLDEARKAVRCELESQTGQGAIRYIPSPAGHDRWMIVQ